jgi:hypothetical protein
MSVDKEAGQEVARAKRPGGERMIGTEGWDVGQTRVNDVLPLIESNLTIQEVAERLGISVEAACALVVASLKSKHKEGGGAKEEIALLEASFKPIEDGSLWEKDGVYYGREAAVQEAQLKLSEGETTTTRPSGSLSLGEG